MSHGTDAVCSCIGTKNSSSIPIQKHFCFSQTETNDLISIHRKDSQGCVHNSSFRTLKTPMETPEGKEGFSQGQGEDHPKRNLSLYFTVLGLLRGAERGTFGLIGLGGFFFSGTVTVKESSGCSDCLNLGRKWVETC